MKSISLGTGKRMENESRDSLGREKPAASQKRELRDEAYIFGMAEVSDPASSSSVSDSRPRSLAIPL